jgi:hypothetical protein
MMEAIKKGVDPKQAYKRTWAHMAVSKRGKYIDPRHQKRR